MSQGQTEPDQVQAFATRLRELREAAGSPSFRQMARKAHFSSSTLAEAVQGRRLPSPPVVAAFASACDADPQEWVDRMPPAATQPPGAQPVDGQPAEPPGEPPVRRLRGRAVRAVTAVVVLGAALGAGALLEAMLARHNETVPRSGAPATVAALPHDGADPSDAGCNDPVVLAHNPMTAGEHPIGDLELRYSAQCKGGWARFFLRDGADPALVELRLEASDGRLVAFAQTATAGLPLYTDLLRPGGSCLRALAIEHLRGSLVTATTACLSPTT